MLVEQARFLERIRFRGVGSSRRIRPFRSCGRLYDERPGTSKAASRRAGRSGPPARGTALRRNRSPPDPTKHLFFASWRSLCVFA
jgi:hypothetical protein